MFCCACMPFDVVMCFVRLLLLLLLSSSLLLLFVHLGSGGGGGGCHETKVQLFFFTPRDLSGQQQGHQGSTGCKKGIGHRGAVTVNVLNHFVAVITVRWCYTPLDEVGNNRV